MRQTFTDVACTVCGCVCDDLQIEITDARAVPVRGACRLSEAWFARLSDAAERPRALVGVRSAAYEEAIERAVEILRGSKSPLVWGLARSSTAGQRAAVALAEQIGGTIDTPASAKRQIAAAFQKLGKSTCTLGEVRNRADLVIFWRANPVVTHPRHLERYSVEPRGLFLPRGRADRTVVVVDVTASETSRLADAFLQIAAGDEADVIEILRKLVAGGDAGDTTLSAELISQLRQLAERMTACRYGALFYGGEREFVESSRNVAELLFGLTVELNKSTRFTVHELGPTSGMTGAESVITWQTGFPYAVNFADGYPRHDVEKFSADGMLQRGEVDACVIVGSECAGQLTPTAQERLRGLPTIALDYPNVENQFAATVKFTTAVYGIHAVGTAYRMDGVSIPLRKILDAEYPTDDGVLNEIALLLKA